MSPSSYRYFFFLFSFLFPGSSDEGESTSGATGGGGGSENAEMEENGSTRTSSNSSGNNPVYRDLKPHQAGGAHEVPQDYNPQSRSAYQQRGYLPGMERPRNYEKEHQPSPSSREEERKSAWDYSEKSARKEYSRSRDYSNEYRESGEKGFFRETRSRHEILAPLPPISVIAEGRLEIVYTQTSRTYLIGRTNLQFEDPRYRDSRDLISGFRVDSSL